MRTPLLPNLYLLLLCACGGDDLLLPDGVPAQLRAVSGDGQTAPVGDPVRHPLVVEALDRGGRPFPGAAVVFEFLDPARGAEISAPNAVTDASGRASAEVTLGNAEGDQPVVARLDDPGSDLHVRFLLTALERPQPPAPAPPSNPPSPPPPGGGGEDGDDDGGEGGGDDGGEDGDDDSGGGNDDGGKGKGKDKGKDKDHDNGGPREGGDDDD